MDVTDESPVLANVVSGLSAPSGLLVHEDYLYVIQNTGNKISKIDLTVTNPTPIDVVTNLDLPALGMVLYENELYFSEHGANKISKIDITSPNPVATEVVSGLNGPSDLLVIDDFLYIVEYDGNKISKFDLKATLSNPDYQQESALKLLPNPSKDFISLSGLTETASFQIFSVAGKEISHGTITKGDQIDIKSLASGMYFFKVDNKKTIQFLKE